MSIKILTRVCVCVCAGVCVCVFRECPSILCQGFKLSFNSTKSKTETKMLEIDPGSPRPSFLVHVFSLFYTCDLSHSSQLPVCLEGWTSSDLAGDSNGGNPCFVEQRATKRARIMSWGLLKKQSSLVIILPWISNNDWISILRQVMMINLLWISYMKSYPKGSMGLEYLPTNSP